MNEFREIGLEREFFTLRRGIESPSERIVEPADYEFPRDIFGFLTEITSKPWMHLNTVKMTWDMEKSYWEHRADKFGIELVDIPYIDVPRKTAQYFYDKYGAVNYQDLTQNIYNKHGIDGPEECKSHHLGMFFNGENCRLTSGFHVHFGIRNEFGIIVPFTKDQIKSIVLHMDESFDKEISETERIKGEWEPKQHGFEYRSLPCNVDVYSVLKEAFKILRSI